jgi:hypothetical protein
MNMRLADSKKNAIEQTALMLTPLEVFPSLFREKSYWVDDEDLHEPEPSTEHGQALQKEAIQQAKRRE